MTVPAAILLPRVRIDHYDPDTNRDGYQRQSDPRRCKDVCDFISKGNICPTSLLLNRRVEDGELVLRDTATGKSVKLPKIEPGRAYDLEVPDDLWGIDGQHRYGGFKMLPELPPYFDVPVVLMHVTRDEERRQFCVVNSTAKSVPTDLAQQNMLVAVDKSSPTEMMASLPKSLAKDISWKYTATVITNYLYKDSESVWFKRIHVAGLHKDDARACTIQQATFVRSLVYLLKDSPGINIMDWQEVSAMINALWRGIREVWPKCFQFDKQYVLMTVIGVEVMHRFLAWVYENRQPDPQNRLLFFDPSTYANLLSITGWDAEKWNKTTGFGRFGANWATYKSVLTELQIAIARAQQREAEEGQDEAATA